MARASLPVNGSQSALTAVVKDALLRHYGSLKAAAITMGEMDQGQLTRELDSGKLNLARLELLDDAGKAEVAKRLHEAFMAALESPQAHAQRVIREARQKLDELADYVRFIA
jgi:hypothetical protein